MPAYSLEQTPVEFEMDVASARSVEAGDMTIAFEHMSPGIDTTPLFRGLPDDACQCPHWGYVIRGQFRAIATDGTEETVSAGQAYHLPPGHNCVFDEDTLLLEFSPTAARAETMQHAAQMMEAAEA
jgi:hypothetical protein